MIVNIFENISVTTEGSSIVKYLLENLKWSEPPVNWDIRIMQHESYKIGFSDLNFHIDYISPLALKNTNCNILIPDLDKFPKSHLDYLDYIDLILVKNVDDMEKYRNFFGKGIRIIELGWGVYMKSVFSPKTTRQPFTILSSENGAEVLELAKNWRSKHSLKIYTLSKTDDILLDLLGLPNIEIINSGVFNTSSINIITDRTFNYTYLLHNLCMGMVLFYVNTKPRGCNYYKFNMERFDDIVDDMDVENISTQNYKKYEKKVNRFAQNFLEILEKFYFKKFPTPYMPKIVDFSEVQNYPVVKLLTSSEELTPLQKYCYNNLDYPKEKIVFSGDSDYTMVFSDKYYYHPLSIKNRLAEIMDSPYKMLYSSTIPNYDYAHRLSTIVVEPLTKIFKDRIVNESLFYSELTANFREMKEMDWRKYFVGLIVHDDVKYEPNGCHFINEDGFDQNIISSSGSLNYLTSL
jgi:hypothetical protein